MKRQGFTLAETLITLGIIGVVATLTLPNLMADYKKKTYIAQLQRSYNMIVSAAEMLMVDQDVDNLEDTFLSEEGGATRFLKQYFRVTKDCGQASTTNPCNGSGYKRVDGSAVVNGQLAPGHMYCINVNTGATICMNDMDIGTDGYHGSSEITLDINGKKAPNKNGQDRFYMNLYSDGKLADRYDSEVYTEEATAKDRCLNQDNRGASYGGNCIDYIIDSGWQMDY